MEDIERFYLGFKMKQQKRNQIPPINEKGINRKAICPSPLHILTHYSAIYKPKINPLNNEN
jgi:hypothetical protein